MDARPPAVLGLDLGTSQVKALLCASDGTVLGQGLAGYQVSTPRPGWAEADAEQWWHATCTAVRSAVGPVPAEVVGLAVVGQMHGLILVTERSGLLRPPIIWLDRRASAEVADYQRLPAGLRARLGNAPSAGMAGPLLLWMSRHEPGAYRRARWMLQPKDWLRLRLTGQVATDPTDASGTLLFDLARGAWATDVARALGLRTDLLPGIRPPAEIAGTLLPAAAEQLGLRPGLPVATGAADTAASLLAAQLPAATGLPAAAPAATGLPAVAPAATGLPAVVPAATGLPAAAELPAADRWGLLTLGTGGQLIVPSLPPDPDIPFSDYPDPGSPGSGGATLNGTTNLFRSVDGGTYRLAGAQNVGVTLDWVRRTLGASWDELYGTAGRPWQADTPVFLPQLAGERWDDRGAGGAWIGLTLAHERDDLMRAALEGVAFLLRGKLDDMRAAGCAPARIRLAGGGTRHPAWRKLLADVLAVPLYPAGSGWLTASGAALIAAAVTGMMTWARTPDRSGEDEEAVVRTSQLAEASYRRFRSPASR
jgi:xylulokinase